MTSCTTCCCSPIVRSTAISAKGSPLLSMFKERLFQDPTSVDSRIKVRQTLLLMLNVSFIPSKRSSPSRSVSSSATYEASSHHAVQHFCQCPSHRTIQYRHRTWHGSCEQYCDVGPRRTYSQEPCVSLHSSAVMIAVLIVTLAYCLAHPGESMTL